MKRYAILITFFLSLSFILQAEHVVHVSTNDKISDALDIARKVYAESGESSIIMIEPGTYYEELTIDVPNVTLRNAAAEPSIEMRSGGVDIAEGAVRISWYCGHGYQYKSMGSRFNYGGKRERRWNASVLVTAPGFRAENIIFENSFNMYVSPAELQDSLVDITRAEELCGQDMSAYWSERERPKRLMPNRPKVAYNTEVQNRMYRERASAISFTSEATGCVLKNCRVIGRQDAFYGDHGASVLVEGGALCGAVDYIFGGLSLTVRGTELVGMVNTEKNDVCYISAGRGANLDSIAAHPEWRDSIPKDEIVEQGMLFEDCLVRFATPDELCSPSNHPIYLGRPWRWWGETVFTNTKADEGVLAEERWSLGLTKGHKAPFVADR